MKYLGLLLFLLFGEQIYSAHIVGGNVTYQYLGSNQYKLTFRVYRDCSNSVTTPFDGDSSAASQQGTVTPFYIAVLRSDNGADILSGTNKELFLKTKQRVKSIIVNECVDTNAACVEEAIYEKIITISNPNISYVVMHSRCCRNSGIANLDDITSSSGSSKPGLTIYTVIPPLASFTNNSAVFRSFPPLFLCANQPLYFNHSATDADGDVLRYSLVQPLAGGLSSNPIVQNPTLSNLSNYAAWLSPYNLTDVIGGSPVIKIDSVSGLLTANPSTVGRFVVSVMVKEYRGGVLLDSSIRDFQFNVIQCNIPFSDLPVKPGTYNPITRTGEYVTNCKDGKIDFNLSASNADAYVWNFGDPASGTRDTSTSKNPSHTYNDTGIFVVRLISYFKQGQNLICPDTIYRTVRVFPTFRASFGYTAPLYCPGSAVQFSDLSIGTYGNASSWNWDFGNGNTSTVKNPTIPYTTAGTYYVKLSTQNSKQCDADTTIPVIIYPKPTVNATISSFCIGQSTALNCNVTVVAPSVVTNYRWNLPGGGIVNSCNASYTPTSSGTGSVSLWAKTDKGCVDSQSFNFTVFPLPTIQASNDTFICYNKSARLSVKGGVSYVWSPANFLDNPNIQSPTASPSYPSAMKYIVKGTDGNGCSNIDSVSVSFFTKPFISAGPDTSVCLNPSKFVDSVRLNGQGTFSSVYWSPVTGLNNSAIPNPLAKPSVNTVYTFHGTDVNTCLIEDTMNVFVLDPSLDLITRKDTTKCYYDVIQITPIDQGIITKYLWSPSTWVSDVNARSPFFSTQATTTYELYVQNYCYSKRDSIKIIVPSLPQSNMPPIDSICSGDTYQFNLNPSHSYVWSSKDKTLSNILIANPTCSPTITSMYYVVITDNFGCKNYDTMTLIVNYPPLISIFGLKPYLCKGSKMQLTVLTDVKATYKWWDNTFITPRDDTNSIFVNPPVTTTYYIKASSAANCFRIDSFIVNVQEPIRTEVKSPVRICQGKFINLFAGGGFYYRWGPNYNIYDTLVYNPQVFPEKTFNYKVVIANNCFSDTSSVDVYVDTLPKIYLTRDTQIFRGQSIDLEARAAGTLFEWSPKENISNPFIPIVTVEPIESTVYRISVIDDNKCEGKDSVVVTVYGKDVLLLPSGFSPNGDGINDYFYVLKNLNVKKFNFFEVYNRWGEVVYSATNIDGKWDGNIGNDPCPAGSYIWSAEVINHEGKKLKSTGSVELIR